MKRKISVIDSVIENLINIKKTKTIGIKANIYNCDFRDILKKIEINKTTLIYADPPYFKEHYSRYYHVLDTFLFYDYPELTYNPRLKTTTTGRYRNNRIVSDFGKKSLVKKAFFDLVQTVKLYGNKLAISYANTSILDIDYFDELKTEFKIPMKIYDFELMHSGQGQPRNKIVKEYLIIYG